MRLLQSEVLQNGIEIASAYYGVQLVLIQSFNTVQNTLKDMKKWY